MKANPPPSELVPYDAETSSIAIHRLQEDARAYQRRSISPATQKLYADAWVAFHDWCQAHGLPHLPASAQTVCLFLTARAEHHVHRSVRRDAAAIAFLHRLARLDSPTESEEVRLLLRGMARVKGDIAKPKRALAVEDVRAILPRIPDSLSGQRDRALLLVGLYGALRRSEMASLQVEGVEFVDGAVVLLLRSTKTDVTGKGARVVVRSHLDREVCAVAALATWLESAGIAGGPVFREVDRYGHVGPGALSTQAIAQIVKRWVAEIGLDPALFSGHSLRRGFATTASRQGVPLQKIAAHMRHATPASTFHYIEVSEAVRDGVLLDV